MKSPKDIYESLVVRMSVARRTQHISYDQLCEACDIDKEKSVADWNVVDIVRVAEYLGVSVDYLLGLKEVDKATILSLYRNQLSKLDALKKIKKDVSKQIIKEEKILKNITKKGENIHETKCE